MKKELIRYKRADGVALSGTLYLPPGYTPAQGPLGSALAQHFRIDWDESYIFLRNGQAYTKSTGYFEVARALGGWWRVGLVLQIIPRALRDWVYDMIARNRYRWFGKTAQACALLTPEQRARLV